MCAADRDHQVQADRSMAVRFHVVRAGACDRGCVETQNSLRISASGSTDFPHFVVLKIFPIKNDLSPSNRTYNAFLARNFTR